MLKYRNTKHNFQGKTFDSKKEWTRWMLLSDDQQRGKIINLQHHQVFPIQVNGIKICSYEADFTYTVTATGEFVVEDVKSEVTRKIPLYRLKKKLLEAVSGIKISEV